MFNSSPLIANFHSKELLRVWLASESTSLQVNEMLDLCQAIACQMAEVKSFSGFCLL